MIDSLDRFTGSLWCDQGKCLIEILQGLCHAQREAPPKKRRIGPNHHES